MLVKGKTKRDRYARGNQSNLWLRNSSLFLIHRSGSSDNAQKEKKKAEQERKRREREERKKEEAERRRSKEKERKLSEKRDRDVEKAEENTYENTHIESEREPDVVPTNTDDTSSPSGLSDDDKAY